MFFTHRKESKLPESTGKDHEITEEKYINRLWQFISENTCNSISYELQQVSIVDLGHRLDKVYDFTSKGVHDDVDEFEVNQCIIQTYLFNR